MNDTKLRGRLTIGIIFTGPVFMLHRSLKRTRERLSRFLKIGVVRRFTVGTPMPLVGARVCIEHDDTMIDISVSYVEFAGGLIDDHIRGRSEVLGVVTAMPLA